MALPVPVIEFWALITRSSIMTSFKEQNYSKVIFSFRQIIEISWVWATLSLNMQICYYGATFSFKLSFRGNWKTFKASVLCHSISEVKISKELKNECENLLNLTRRVLILSNYIDFRIFFLKIKSIFFL